MIHYPLLSFFFFNLAFTCETKLPHLCCIAQCTYCCKKLLLTNLFTQRKKNHLEFVNFYQFSKKSCIYCIKKKLRLNYFYLPFVFQTLNLLSFAYQNFGSFAAWNFNPSETVCLPTVSTNEIISSWHATCFVTQYCPDIAVCCAAFSICIVKFCDYPPPAGCVTHLHN